MTYRYLLFYKPYNVLSQFTDARIGTQTDGQPKAQKHKHIKHPDRQAPRQTLGNFIDVPGVYAVGRLDRDSEGLLLLTDDGAMQHRLSHPKFGHWRQYWVQVEQANTSPPIEEALAQLRQGVIIRGYQTRPAKAKEIAPPDLPPRNPPIRYRKQVPTTWVEVLLSEGKNRQVRRMTAAVGFPTLRLVRYGMWLTSNIDDLGSHDSESKPLTLCGLQPGEWRDLTPDEVRSLPHQTSTKSANKKSSKRAARKSKAAKKSTSRKSTSRRASAKKSLKRSSTQKPRARKSQS